MFRSIIDFIRSEQFPIALCTNALWAGVEPRPPQHCSKRGCDIGREISSGEAWDPLS